MTTKKALSSKSSSKKKEVNSAKKITNKNKLISTIIKLILITLLISSMYLMSLSYSNSIHLLAVSEDENGKLTGGSVIELFLKIKPGSGETYVNLNTIREVDTQISILNSKKAACLIFELDCSKYDFYYDFKGSALILKGPSASSAIAILTAKTINREHINDDIAITGSLSSGGLIGSVGGINEKIEVAENREYKKVLVPFFSKYNSSKKLDIIPVLDIVTAYNEFGGKKYSLKNKAVRTKEFSQTMKELSELMCLRAKEIKKLINTDSIRQNSSLDKYFKSAIDSFNSSRKTYNEENYYSTGSFCYNSNINYRIVQKIQENLSFNEINNSINKLNNKIVVKEKDIENIAKNTTSLNDFYVTLLLFDRTSEAKKMLEDAKKQLNSNETNTTKATIFYSKALERFNTVGLWQLFIQNKKSTYSFNNRILGKACEKITKEITIKSKLLENFNSNLLDNLVNKQNNLLRTNSNKYLCIYQGLELIGRLDTMLNSVNINTNKSEAYVKNILDFTQKRIELNSNGDFPFIPYIYFEYSSDLFTTKQYYPAMLYANFALSYSDLNLYLEQDNFLDTSKIRKFFFELFENFWFVLAVLLLIGFV